MTDVDSLKEAIAQYELQLAQVQTTLTNTSKGPDRDNLLSLKSDIEELISLTKESLDSLLGNSTKEKEETIDDDEDPLAKEYALFKAELEACSDVSKNTEQSESITGTSGNIEDDLKELEGLKCRAPYGSSWGGTGFHSAMVCSAYKEGNEEVKSMQDVKVKVFFINPIHKEMLPCSYFLDGKCRFSDEECRFSHGEIVSLSSLQEYREPDYNSIKVGSRILAKQKNHLWHRSVVLKLPEKDNDNYRVKLEINGNIMEVALQDMLPLDDVDLEISDTSDDSESEDNEPEFEDNDIIQKSLLMVQPNEPLGNWEKHTRGIGSKLMAQMGYIAGTGLGKRADGIIKPVEATVLPAGKSLDHCMELRENACGDKNLFSVERRMRKQQRKLEQQRERQYQREKEREKNNVFNFINTTLGDKPKSDPAASSSKIKNNLKMESNQKLNVASFQIGENITRLEKEALKLKNSLSRHAKGSPIHNSIVMKYNEKQKELSDLRASEKNIADEQNQRKNKAKLSIF